MGLGAGKERSCASWVRADTATSLLSQWLAVVTHALIEDDSSRISDTKAGPHTELQYWQVRCMRCEHTTSV